jgi:hypothetical protein
MELCRHTLQFTGLVGKPTHQWRQHLWWFNVIHKNVSAVKIVNYSKAINISWFSLRYVRNVPLICVHFKVFKTILTDFINATLNEVFIYFLCQQKPSVFG